MNKHLREMLAGYVDGELSAADKATFEAELLVNAELRVELAEFKKLEQVTGLAQYADLPPEVWESYWQNLYRKTERGIGWMLYSIGFIILAGFGGYHLFAELYADPEAPLWLKIGLSALGGGSIFLLVSFGRERIFAYNRERYREVDR